MAKIPVTISLNPEIYDAIDRLSKLQGASKASILNEYLSPAVETMTAVAEMIEMLKNATPEQREVFKTKMDTVEKQAIDQLKNLNDSTKGLLHD